LNTSVEDLLAHLRFHHGKGKRDLDHTVISDYLMGLQVALKEAAVGELRLAAEKGVDTMLTNADRLFCQLIE